MVCTLLAPVLNLTLARPHTIGTVGLSRPSPASLKQHANEKRTHANSATVATADR